MMRELRMLRCLWREESGQGLVVATLFMVVILGFAAMAIDVGLFMHEKRELQKAADAAALAGAQELPYSPAHAEQEAAEWAEKNGIDSDELEAIEIASTYAANDTITVEVKREVSFVFARVLGLTSDTIRADATARVGSPAEMAGLVPFGVLDDAISFTESTILKYDAQNVSHGNFGALGIDGPGAKIYSDTIEHGSESPLCSQSQETCADPTTETEPGNMVGPTREAVEWRIDHTSPACDQFDEVFQEVAGTYRLTSQCNPFPSTGPNDSSRVVIVPVIGELCNGRCDVTILKFAMFFLDELGDCKGNSCEVTGRFVDAQANVGGLMGALDPDGLIRFVRLVE
jgi:Flp pilus assembly protein TadG